MANRWKGIVARLRFLYNHQILIELKEKFTLSILNAISIDLDVTSAKELPSTEDIH